jgi:hypothetical protein
MPLIVCLETQGVAPGVLLVRGRVAHQWWQVVCLVELALSELAFEMAMGEGLWEAME